MTSVLSYVMAGKCFSGPLMFIQFMSGSYSRRLAVGLESGEIFIYSSHSNAANDWALELAIGSEYVSYSESIRVLT